MDRNGEGLHGSNQGYLGVGKKDDLVFTPGDVGTSEDIAPQPARPLSQGASRLLDRPSIASQKKTALGLAQA